ncbi:GNAT family N-acetyltransferase [Risungbinella massiliensis]|uniref:GNAT family N-acetyltransferase n=1 Tax=Risungbinella massiliensis TaxID=1329796 RepID=UPI0005CC2ADD|nr:GNAT family N-acetyltransferase [Risungbinella massiliensis]
MVIREINENNAKEFNRHLSALDSETTFLLFEPGERNMNESTQRARLNQIISKSNQTIIIAEQNKAIVGHIALMGGFCKRNSSTATLVIALEEPFRNQGLGKTLMSFAIDWASNSNMHRIELTVMSHNNNAIHLYENFGFAKEGVRRESLLVGREYVDELYMGKILT